MKNKIYLLILIITLFSFGGCLIDIEENEDINISIIVNTPIVSAGSSIEYEAILNSETPVTLTGYKITYYQTLTSSSTMNIAEGNMNNYFAAKDATADISVLTNARLITGDAEEIYAKVTFTFETEGKNEIEYETQFIKINATTTTVTTDGPRISNIIAYNKKKTLILTV